VVLSLPIDLVRLEFHVRSPGDGNRPKELEQWGMFWVQAKVAGAPVGDAGDEMRALIESLRRQASEVVGSQREQCDQDKTSRQRQDVESPH
jgi:hypothetical protein